jgi:CRP-like cAMP-binding protein
VTADEAAFAALLASTAEIRKEAALAVVAVSAERTFAPGAWLLREGERATSCFFVAEGLLRELYIDGRGVEHTRAFIAEGDLAGSLLDLLSGEPSITWIQALEPTRTRVFAYAEIERLSARYPELHVLARRWAEGLYVRKARREHELLALSAAERYARWRRDHAGIDARVSRRHLASYLGVTPEHLSRLRAAVVRTPRPRGGVRSRSK